MTEKKRGGRNIKIVVTDDISHIGISEEEYRIVEEHAEADIVLTSKDEAFVVKERKWKSN